MKSLNKQKCSKFGSKAKFRGSENVFFNLFFLDSFSASAKILAHLQVTQLYLIFNAADHMEQWAIKI